MSFIGNLIVKRFIQPAHDMRLSQFIELASGSAEIVLQSVLPRNAKFRDRIKDLNERYQQLARDQRITFLDLWPVLSGADGSLKPEFTLDSLHLNGAAYRAWVSVLRNHIA